MILTYNIKQIIKDVSGMRTLLNDIKGLATTKIKAHSNLRYEVLDINLESLRLYCELTNFPYWDLIFLAITKCKESELDEINNYSQIISNIENIYCIITAHKDIKNYQVPNSFDNNIGIDSEGNEIQFNKTFNQFFYVEDIENDMVKMTIKNPTCYCTKEQLLDIKTFGEENSNLSIIFL